MKNLALEHHSDGSASVFDIGKNRRYKRQIARDGGHRWFQRKGDALRTISNRRARRLERIYQNPEKVKPVLRLPRRTAEDVARSRVAYRMSELETRACEWIGRGREANVKLGHTLILLKTLLRKLVGHGHFEDYYEKKFAEPYGISFRTAQEYMRLARHEDEAKGADSALFPKAMDPQAVAMRETTAKARAAVAEVKQHRSERTSASTETDKREPSEDSRNSMVTCRLHIRMTNEQRTRISALWKSKHRQSAEVAGTELPLEQCAKYHITGTAPNIDDN